MSISYEDYIASRRFEDIRAVSIAMGRRFIGIELKKAYFDVAVGNLENPLEAAAVVDGISEESLSERNHWDYARLCKERDDLNTRIKTIDRAA